MKKTYQTPATTTIYVETCIMQNTSLGVYSDNTVSSESDLLSRGRNRNVWDDEEDEW